jgi:hypothetical protein
MFQQYFRSAYLLVVKLSLRLTKRYAMKMYGGVDV